MASASAPRATVDRPSATSTAATNTTPPTAASGGAGPPNESNTSSRGDGAGTGEGGAGGSGAPAGTSTPLDGPASGGRRASGAGWVEVEEGVIEILDDEGEGEGDGGTQLSPASEAQAMALVVLQFDVGLEADTALRALNATAEPGNTASMEWAERAQMWLLEEAQAQPAPPAAGGTSVLEPGEPPQMGHTNGVGARGVAVGGAPTGAVAANQEASASGSGSGAQASGAGQVKEGESGAPRGVQAGDGSDSDEEEELAAACRQVRSIAAAAQPPPDPPADGAGDAEVRQRRMAALQRLVDSGEATKERAAEALEAVGARATSIEWADHAQIWLAQAMETEQEIADTRQAMELSRADAEATPLVHQPTERLQDRYSGSAVLRALGSAALLDCAELRDAVIAFLEQERLCVRWWRNGAEGYFEQLAAQWRLRLADLPSARPGTSRQASGWSGRGAPPRKRARNQRAGKAPMEPSEDDAPESGASGPSQPLYRPGTELTEDNIATLTSLLAEETASVRQATSQREPGLPSLFAPYHQEIVLDLMNEFDEEGGANAASGGPSS